MTKTLKRIQINSDIGLKKLYSCVLITNDYSRPIRLLLEAYIETVVYAGHS